MFSCVWLHFKKCFGKYFLMFGCVLENTIDNTFSTCCSHFLTFSRLPNEYIISFIPQNTNKTQKKKSSNLNKRRRDRDCDLDRWDRDRHYRDHTKRRSRSRSKLRAIAIAIDASRNASIAIMIDADRRNAGDHAVVFGTLVDRRLVRWSVFGS